MQFQSLFLFTLFALFFFTIVKAQEDDGGECTEDELECLRKVIPGEPKKDYPIYGPSILCKLNPKNPGCPGFGKK